MRFSVVIPNYNDRRIRRAVASIRRQTWTDYELIIIDGGSTDADVLAFYEDCGADRLVVEKDEGIFHGMNKGIRLAAGDVVYLLGSDDELSDERVFADVARELMSDPTLDGVAMGCEFINAAGEVIRTWYPGAVTSERIKIGIMPAHFSFFLRRELYTLVGEFKYREYDNVACDTLWLLDLAIAKSALRIKTLPQHHVRMEYGGASTRSLRAVWNQFRVVHAYARLRAKHLRFWFAYSPLRTFSKLFQFRIPKRRAKPLERRDGVLSRV
jgi:glycosyltransferase